MLRQLGSSTTPYSLIAAAGSCLCFQTSSALETIHFTNLKLCLTLGLANSGESDFSRYLVSPLCYCSYFGYHCSVTGSSVHHLAASKFLMSLQSIDSSCN